MMTISITGRSSRCSNEIVIVCQQARTMHHNADSPPTLGPTLLIVRGYAAQLASLGFLALAQFHELDKALKHCLRAF